jgi:O-antigen ligase
MEEMNKKKWAKRLDKYCIYIAAMVPTGLIIGNAGFESMIALVIVLWIGRHLITRDNPFRQIIKHPVVIPWLIWLISIAASLVWNGAGSKGWSHDIALVRYFLFFSALLDISFRKELSRAMLAGLGAGVLWGLFNTILVHMVGVDLFGHELPRYTGKLKEAARISSLAAYTAPFFIVWGLAGFFNSVKMRIGVLLIGFISAGQIINIHVRTVEIAAIMGIAAFILYTFIKRKPGLTLFFTVAAVIAASAALYTFGSHISLFSFYDRINIWKVTLVMIGENPIFGVSVSAWQDAYREIALSGQITPLADSRGVVTWSKEAYHAHNLVLHILSCTGIIGLLSFCWLYINHLKLILKTKIEGWKTGLITWPAVFLTIGLTGWNIYGSQYQILFAYFMILTCAGAQEQEQA